MNNDEHVHQEMVRKFEFLEKKISEINSREKLIYIICSSKDELEKNLHF